MEVVRYEEGVEYHAPNQPDRRVKIFKPENFSESDKIQVGMTLIAPKQKGSLHAHETSETMILIHGEGRWFTQDKHYDLKPLSVVYVPPRELHGYENLSSTQTLEFIWIYTPAGAEKAIEKGWVKV